MPRGEAGVPHDSGQAPGGRLADPGLRAHTGDLQGAGVRSPPSTPAQTHICPVLHIHTHTQHRPTQPSIFTPVKHTMSTHSCSSTYARAHSP